MRRTLGELCASADKIRLVAAALEDTAGQLPSDAEGDDLRQVAVIVKTHALGMLLSAARIANKAERLQTIVVANLNRTEPAPAKIAEVPTIVRLLALARLAGVVGSR